MQIIAVELENAKSYDHARVEFMPGVNAIVGHNGAGKSTILEAIGFALFDSLSYRQSDFVREGATTATVTVTFFSDLDERTYQVVRRCGASNQYFIFDPDLEEKLCEGKADVLSFLRQQLGVEPGADLSKLFSDAVGVPQGTFTAAFLLTPAQRKAVFDPLLQVEEYKQAYDRLREPANLLRNRRQEQAMEAAALEARLEQLPHLEEAVAGQTQELAAAKVAAANARQRLESATAQRGELEDVRQRLADLRAQATQLEERGAGLQSRVQDLTQAVTQAEEAHALVTAHAAGHAAYQEAENSRQALQKEVKARQALDVRISRAERELALLADRLRQLQARQEEITQAEQRVAALAPLVARQIELEHALAHARKADARLNDTREEAARLQHEQARRSRRRESLAAQLSNAQSLATRRQELEQSIAECRQEGETATAALAQHEAEGKRLREQIAQLEEISTARCPVCEQPLDNDHRQELLARNQERLATLRQAFSRSREQKQQAAHALTEHQGRLKSVDQELAALPRPAELTELEQTLTELTETLATVQRRLSDLEGAPEQVATLEKQLAELGDPRGRHAVAAAQASDRAQVEQHLQEATAAQAARQAELDALVQEAGQFQDLEVKLAEFDATLVRHRTAYQTVLANQQVALTLPQRRRELADLYKQQTALQQEANELQKILQQTEIQFNVEAYQSFLAAEERAREEFNQLQTRCALLQQSISQNQRQIDDLQVHQARLATVRIGIAQLEHQEAVLDTLRGILRQAGPYITQALLRQISDSANHIFGDIMQDYSRRLSWTEEYGIVLDVDGNERQFAQLSGGEQMSAALAVRLALLHEMSAINVAFFDEPTSNLDAARREALAQQILQVKGLEQLFVISHDDTFEQATEHLLRVTMHDGISVLQPG